MKINTELMAVQWHFAGGITGFSKNYSKKLFNYQAKLSLHLFEYRRRQKKNNKTSTMQQCTPGTKINKSNKSKVKNPAN